jgi:hypothetical protein
MLGILLTHMLDMKRKGKKKMIIRKLSFVFLSVSLTVLSLPIQLIAQQESKLTYDSLLEQVKKGDPAADFTALRLAYADNPPKDSGGIDADANKEMHSALRSKQYSKAIEYAEKIVKGKFVDINAHLVLAIAYKEKNDKDKEKFHSYVAEGLIKSILKSGDGKSQETAFVVISTDEEYVILRVFGLMPGT